MLPLAFWRGGVLRFAGDGCSCRGTLSGIQALSTLSHLNVENPSQKNILHFFFSYGKIKISTKKETKNDLQEI
jgi:hypothetical protein